MTTLLSLVPRMQDGCLIADWVITPILVTACIVLYALPRKRLHPSATYFLGFLFFNIAFQFLLLNWAVSQLEKTGHAEVITLLIPVMALGATGLLWVFWCFTEIATASLVVLMIEQNTDLEIGLPLALIIGVAVWLIVMCTPINSIRHQFQVTVFSSVVTVIGIGEIILETSTPVDDLPMQCQSHFNMFITCDAQCSSIENYSAPGARAGVAVAILFLLLLRACFLASCTTICIDKPDLKSSCLCCDCVSYNNDRWISTKDRKQAVLGIDHIDTEEDDDDL